MANKDLWNINKIKFHTGYGNANWIMIFDPYKLLFLTDLDN